MQKLFSYGTLQQENVQQETFGRTLEGKKDILVGYIISEVKITNPDVLAKSGKEYHPILVPTKNFTDEVAGTIFEVTDAELAQADEYEVDDYARVIAECKSGCVAWVYADAKLV